MNKVNALTGEPCAFEEGINNLKKSKEYKFNESVDVTINLVSPGKKEAQSVVGFVKAPNPLEKVLTIAVFDDLQPNNIDSNCYWGVQNLIDDFKVDKKLARKCDICISKPEYMQKISSQLGKVLGRRRLIPDIKLGTVSNNIQQTLDSFKSGVMQFRSNKNIIHCSIGKIKHESNHLKENFDALISAIRSSLQGNMQIGSIYISSTMSCSQKILLEKGGAI